MSMRILDPSFFTSVSVDQATEIGQKARDFARQFLTRDASPVRILHAHEAVYGDPNRVYAFVANGKNELLHEQLVREGLVRLRKTKGPDVRLEAWDAEKSWELGFPRDLLAAAVDERRLRSLESDAKKARRGGWSYGQEFLESGSGDEL